MTNVTLIIQQYKKSSYHNNYRTLVNKLFRLWSNNQDPYTTKVKKNLKSI